MSKHMERALDGLQRTLLLLSGSVEEAICRAVQALQERNPSLAQQVIDGDSVIDREENVVEEECLKFLALYQPVCIDLRRVTSILKINAELERIADLAEDIAERVLHLAREPAIPLPAHLQRMTDLTTAMVRQSLQSFVELDARLARRVIRLDDEVDRYNQEIIEEQLNTMRRSREMIPLCISLFSAVRHLERIADHATNIAEDVIYLIEGEIVRHRPNRVATDP